MSAARSQTSCLATALLSLTSFACAANVPADEPEPKLVPAAPALVVACLASGACKALLLTVLAPGVVDALQQGGQAASDTWEQLAPPLRDSAQRLVALRLIPEHSDDTSGTCFCIAWCGSCRDGSDQAFMLYEAASLLSCNRFVRVSLMKALCTAQECAALVLENSHCWFSQHPLSR